MSGTVEQQRMLERTEELVSRSAHRIVGVIDGMQPYWRERLGLEGHAVGHAAVGLMLAEDVPHAHDYVAYAMKELKMDFEAAHDVWAELYKNGDKTNRDEIALVNAYTTLRHASKDIPTAEGVYRYQAVKYVDLVEAGDKMNIEHARAVTQRIPVLPIHMFANRTALFGRLYAAGDDASLGLALEANTQAKETASGIDLLMHRGDGILSNMASSAAESGKVSDALKLLGVIEGETKKAGVHLELFKRGRQESLQPVLDYLKTVEGEFERRTVQRDLAEAGYGAAQKAVRDRAAHRLSEQSMSADLLRDLSTLRTIGIGEPSVTRTVERLVRVDKNAHNYVGMLGAVGLHGLDVEMVSQTYEADPTPENARELLKRRHTNKLWRIVFDDFLKSDNILHAAQLVAELGAYVQTLKVKA